MRTTVEIPDQDRAALLRIAAERGEAGYSSVLPQAVREFLLRHDEAERRERAERLIQAIEEFPQDLAERIAANIDEQRSRWP